jgi:hypothetical protein
MVCCVTSASTLPTTRPVPRFVPAIPADAVGINMHPERYDDKTADIHFEKLRDLGIKQIRIAVEWSCVEPAKGQWNFTPMDRVLVRARKDNVKILSVLCYNTQWNASYVPQSDEERALGPKCKPKDMNAWREFVRQMAERYKKDITWWEVWNEQNCWMTGPYAEFPERRWTDYREIIQAAYEVLKEVNPENAVIFGGFAHDYDDWWETMEAYYRVGAVKYCDVMAFHPYPGRADPLNTQWYPRYIDEILAVMAKHGDSKKPVWITEVGYAVTGVTSNATVTEAQQADYLADLLLVPLARKQVEKVFFYTVWDEENHGLYRKDWTAKPAALRMKQLMNP